MTKTDQQDKELKAVDIPIGISACVLGQEVRYNGGHKLDRFIRDTLGTYVRFVPVCPEVEIGLGIPRETLRLVRGDENNEAVRLVAPKSDTDHTERMESYARKRTKDLAKESLCGYILQKGGGRQCTGYGARNAGRPESPSRASRDRHRDQIRGAERCGLRLGFGRGLPGRWGSDEFSRPFSVADQGRPRGTESAWDSAMRLRIEFRRGTGTQSARQPHADAQS